MSAQMRNAARGMQTDTNNIAQGTRQIGQAATEMGQRGQQGFQQMGQAATAVQPVIRQTAADINNARTATLGMVSSLAGITTGIVAFETTMTNVPKRLNAIAKAESLVETQQVALARQNTSLQKQTKALTEMRISGKKSAEDIALQEQKVANIRANLNLYTGKLADAQEDLNLKHADYADTLKLMATSAFQTFFSAGVTVTMMLSTMATAAGKTTGEYVKMHLATLSNSKALNFLKIDLATAKANFLGYSSAAAASAKRINCSGNGNPSRKSGHQRIIRRPRSDRLDHNRHHCHLAGLGAQFIRIPGRGSRDFEMASKNVRVDQKDNSIRRSDRRRIPTP